MNQRFVNPDADKSNTQFVSDLLSETWISGVQLVRENLVVAIVVIVMVAGFSCLGTAVVRARDTHTNKQMEAGAKEHKAMWEHRPVQ